MTFARTLPAILAIAILGSACGGRPAGGSPGKAELTILAAASLRDALGELAPAYEAANPATRLVISTGSSAALATQIEQGAPADLFVSADRANADRLVAAGLTRGDPVVVATTELAVIVPSGNPAGLVTPADLARPGLTVIAAADDVPISRYAAEAIRHLATEPGYPADFAARYAANVASKEENVTAVVTKVELGEGDAGIVYATDAAASSSVDLVPIPERANVPVAYVGAVVRSSSDPDTAARFLGWLAGPEGQAILGGFGFRAPLP